MRLVLLLVQFWGLQLLRVMLKVPQVAVGGLNGLASLVTSGLFWWHYFFPFIFAYSSGPRLHQLIFVGFLMMQSVVGIDFTDLTEGIPHLFVL